MLLTSAGITNGVLRDALLDLIGAPFDGVRAAYVPTAALAQPGDSGWLVAAMRRVHELGWREFDVVDLAGLPPHLVLDRVRRADVLYVEGGNHYHLARSISGGGLAEDLLAALETRVHVGVSAGSMIFSRHLTARSAEQIGDVADLHLLGAQTVEPPFGLFDWYVKPHLGSPDFPERDEAWGDRLAARVDFPLYLLDDDTAIRVRGEEVDVVSAGRWRFHPGPGRARGDAPGAR